MSGEREAMTGSPRLSRNIAANIASQIYVTAVGIFVVPLYLRFMSIEVYGLVGFFVVLLAWFNLLDIGLSPTIARETARHRAGALSSLEYRRLARGLQLIFFAVGLAGGFCLLAASDLIAAQWFAGHALSVEEVRRVVELIALGVLLRWLSGLYRAIVAGAERQLWLSGFTVFIATLRFPGSVVVIMLIDASASAFFIYQLAVAAVELAGMAIMARRLMPRLPRGERIGWSLRPIAAPLRFAGTVALSAALGTLVTQSDKLILSTKLPLADYGYFTLAIVAANVVLLIGLPVSTALMPRLAALEAAGRQTELIATYRTTTQFVAVAASTTAFTIWFAAAPLLQLWTGDAEAARRAAPILGLYALGNAVFTIAAFPYYLQYAKGRLTLHLIGQATLAAILAPAIYVTAGDHGAIGTGVLWLAANLAYAAVIAPIVHGRFAPSLKIRWFGVDVLPICIAAGATTSLLHLVLPIASSPLARLGAIVAIGLAGLAGGALAASTVRPHFAPKAAASGGARQDDFPGRQ